MSKEKNNSSQALNSEQLENFLEVVSGTSEQVVEKSKNAVEHSVKIVKEYPLHAAIGAGVVGFITGVISNKVLKK